MILEQDSNNGQYVAPETRYFKTRAEFDIAIGRDFIIHANIVTRNGEIFITGLAHGQSPSGAYKYILDHFDEIDHPNLLYFTATNSHLRRQRDLKSKGVIDATEFLKELLERNYVSKTQIIGKRYNREKMQDYADDYNDEFEVFLKEKGKSGFDYVFTASDSRGRVAGITRKSAAFESKEIMVVVNDRKQEELTITPYFLLKSKRVAFLATKADKRRPLAWLYSKWGKKNESPSFLRHINYVQNRMTVFVDDTALTWPQIELKRESGYGKSIIKVDLATRYNEKAKRKLPVILLIHGFLGLNSYDGLLTTLPSRKYIGAAMHYGTIPNNLPPELYSKHIVKNIDTVVNYFGEKGHNVYIFDHSMGNIYFLMMNADFDNLPGIKKYLKGRIGANPFFGSESKHAFLGFLDYVIIPSFSLMKNPIGKSTLVTARNVVLPLMPEFEIRRQGIQWTRLAIRKNSIVNNNLWKAIKKRVLELMTGLDSLPALNRIPIERALSRLPIKIFAIQIYAALIESEKLRRKKSLRDIERHGIKVMILKSEKDGVAKYAPKYYRSNIVKVIDVTNKEEKDLFREHLYHMVNPLKTSKIIDEFVSPIEKEIKIKNKEVAKNSELSA